MKTTGTPMLIDIKTKAGTLQAVSAHDLKAKHLERMKTILHTIDSKKKRKAAKKDMIAELFYSKALPTFIDRSAFLSLDFIQRGKAAKHWWKASNALHDMEETLKDFSQTP
jgi:hypothetical protein